MADVVGLIGYNTGYKIKFLKNGFDSYIKSHTPIMTANPHSTIGATETIIETAVKSKLEYFAQEYNFSYSVRVRFASNLLSALIDEAAGKWLYLVLEKLRGRGDFSFVMPTYTESEIYCTREEYENPHRVIMTGKDHRHFTIANPTKNASLCKFQSVSYLSKRQENW